MTISLFDRVENTVGKEENTGYQYFLLFPQCFPKPTSFGSLNSGLCGKELKQIFFPATFCLSILMHLRKAVGHLDKKFVSTGEGKQEMP